MRANDGQSFSNISATTAAFTLVGGRYAIDYTATWSSGSVTFQKLAANGSTYVTAATAVTADGTQLVDLPAGTYRFLVATSTAIYIAVSRVPGD